jgi:nucleoid DNA-binding protein
MALVNKMYELFGDELSDFKKSDTKRLADLFMRTVVDEVMAGNNVTLTNHMTFKRAARKARDHKVPVPVRNKDKDSDAVPKIVHKDAHYVMTMEVKPALKSRFEAVAVVEGEEKPKKSKRGGKAAEAESDSE